MLLELELQVLEQLMKGNIPFKVPLQNTGVRLKPPTFDGKSEPKQFFVKLFNYLETYNVENGDEKIRVLKSCLDAGPPYTFI